MDLEHQPGTLTVDIAPFRRVITMRLPATTKRIEFAFTSRWALMRGTLLMLVYLLGGQLSGVAQSTWQTQVIALSAAGRYVGASFRPIAETDHYRVRDGGIWLYDLENPLSPARYLMESRYSDIDLVFSPDSAYIAVVDHDALYVFSIADGRRVFQLQRPIVHWLSEASDKIEFSPDSQYLKAFNIYDSKGHLDGKSVLIPIWDFKTGKLVNAATANPIDQWTRVWLRPDWKQIVVYDIVSDFDIKSGTGPTVGTLDFGAYPGSSDGQGELFHDLKPLFVTATHDCIVQLYDTNTWAIYKTWHHPDSDCEYGISVIDFSRSKPWLAFTNHPTYWDFCDSLKQARLIVWNYEEDLVVFEAATFASSARFTRDDRFIVASRCDAGDDKAQISVWDSENDFAFRTYSGSNPQLHPNSELMVSIGHDGNIWVWNLVHGTPVAILPAISS